MADNVNQPKHYTAGGIETIDYIHANFGAEAFRDYCVGNVLKYASRWRHKNGIEDLRKASVYLLWAINGNPAVKLSDAPPEQHHAVEAPMHPVLDDFPDDDDNFGLTAGTAVQP